MTERRKDSVLCVRFTADQAESINRFAELANISVSDLIRRAVHAVMADPTPLTSATAMALRHHERREWGRFEPDVVSNCGGPGTCPVCRSRGVAGSFNSTPFEVRLAS